MEDATPANEIAMTPMPSAGHVTGLVNLASCINELFHHFTPFEQMPLAIRLYMTGDKRMALALSQLATVNIATFDAYTDARGHFRSMRTGEGRVPCAPLAPFVNLAAVKHARLCLTDVCERPLSWRTHRVSAHFGDRETTPSTNDDQPPARSAWAVIGPSHVTLEDIVRSLPHGLLSLQILLPHPDGDLLQPAFHATTFDDVQFTRSLTRLELCTHEKQPPFDLSHLMCLQDLTIRGPLEMSEGQSWPQTLTRLCMPTVPLKATGPSVATLPPFLSSLECSCLVGCEAPFDWSPWPALTAVTLHCCTDGNRCDHFYANLPPSLTHLTAPFSSENCALLRNVTRSTSRGNGNLRRLSVTHPTSAEIDASMVLPASLEVVDFPVRIHDASLLAVFEPTRINSLRIVLVTTVDRMFLEALRAMPHLQTLTVTPSLPTVSSRFGAPGVTPTFMPLPCTASVRHLTLLTTGVVTYRSVSMFSVIDPKHTLRSLENLSVNTMHLSLQNVRLDANRNKSFNCLLHAGHLSSSLCVMDHEGTTIHKSFLPVPLIGEKLVDGVLPPLLYNRAQFTLSLKSTRAAADDDGMRVSTRGVAVYEQRCRHWFDR